MTLKGLKSRLEGSAIILEQTVSNPFDSSLAILEIRSIKVFSSKSKPWRVTVLCSDQSIRDILFKFENVQSDYACCNLLQVLQSLEGSSAGETSSLPPAYWTLPLTKDGGVVEIIGNAAPLDLTLPMPS